MRENYEKPILEFNMFEVEDVIITSDSTLIGDGEGDDGDDIDED